VYATFIQYKGWQNYQPEYLLINTEITNDNKYHPTKAKAEAEQA